MKQSVQPDAKRSQSAAAEHTATPLLRRAFVPDGRLVQLAAMINGSRRVQALSKLKGEIQRSSRVQNLMGGLAGIDQDSVQMQLPSAGWSKEPEPELLADQPAPIQRRAIGDTSELTSEETEGQKRRLSHEKGELDQLARAVDEACLGIFRNALITAASNDIGRFNSERASNVDVGRGTNYDKLLSLAVAKALKKYGRLVKEAGSAVLVQPKDLKLHQAESRWDEVKNDKELLSSEAVLAAQYYVDTSEGVQKAIDGIQKKAHNENNLLSIEQAYLAALFSDSDKIWVLPLAEARIRWAPLTIGSDIYVAPSKDFSKDYLDTWTHYKYLVHEVLHTAAHPNFVKYISEEAGVGGVANVSFEGTVDFFAQRVWTDIIDELQPNVDNEEVGIVHDIQGKQKNRERVPKALLAKLQQLASTPIYPQQVPVIERAVKELDNGENRLKAAFFYGDVYHFFPRFQTEDLPGENEGQVPTELEGTRPEQEQTQSVDTFPGYFALKPKLERSAKVALLAPSTEFYAALEAFMADYDELLELVPNVLASGTREEKTQLLSVLNMYKRVLTILRAKRNRLKKGKK